MTTTERSRLESALERIATALEESVAIMRARRAREEPACAPGRLATSSTPATDAVQAPAEVTDPRRKRLTPSGLMEWSMSPEDEETARETLQSMRARSR